jgi:hypothetical protein
VSSFVLVVVGVMASLLVPLILALLYRVVVPRLSRFELGGFSVELQQRSDELAEKLSAATWPAIEDGQEAQTEEDEHRGSPLSRDETAAVARTVDALNRRLETVERQTVALEPQRFALLETFYKEGLAQSKVSFWFSLILATAGFGIICAAAISGLSNPSAGTTLGVVSGAVTQAVSALFFAQSNRARRLMQEFSARLSEDQQRQEAFGLARNIEDLTLRGAVEASIALHLVAPDVSPRILPGFDKASSAGGDDVPQQRA